MHVNMIDLEQIAADVVIVLYNTAAGVGRIVPLWECDYIASSYHLSHLD